MKTNNKMTMKEFVRKAELQSKESINRAYRNIEMVQYEISLLNDQLKRYSNKVSGRTLTHRERQNEMNIIRERIPSAYSDINYYKECINAEKKEIKRIFDTYGYPQSSQGKYEHNSDNRFNQQEQEEQLEHQQVNHNDYDEIRDEYEEEEDNYEYPVQDDLEDLEEIKDYTYNSATDTWE
jgi:hypothetical protein